MVMRPVEAEAAQSIQISMVTANGNTIRMLVAVVVVMSEKHIALVHILQVQT
jgi:bisphosphoglycerate-dependent phosphoglycerate mutase